MLFFGFTIATIYELFEGTAASSLIAIVGWLLCVCLGMVNFVIARRLHRLTWRVLRRSPWRTKLSILGLVIYATGLPGAAWMQSEGSLEAWIVTLVLAATALLVGGFRLGRSDLT